MGRPRGSSFAAPGACSAPSRCPAFQEMNFRAEVDRLVDLMGIRGFQNGGIVIFQKICNIL